MFKPVQFGKYYLTERIAVGGMAEIFKAKLYGVSGFEKPMVVKQILPQYARNGEFIKMFIDEAKIAVSLTHGNIIAVYELGRFDGIYFIAMEYVHGKNLAEVFDEAQARELRISPEHALHVAIEVCKGLDYAHRRVDDQGAPLGVVHRDISPANVMLSFTGEVKLADFGIAKAHHKLGSTDAGVVKGTYGYMSPEQLTGRSVDSRTDIFSCGILLYEMLTGQRLFAGGTDLEAVELVKQARVPTPSSVAPWVSPEIDSIIIKALARDPDDRYQAANELQLALARALYSSGSTASASSFAQYMRQLFPRAGSGGVEDRPDESIAARPVQQPAAGRSGPSAVIRKPRKDNSTRSYAARDVLEQIDTDPQPGLSLAGCGAATPGQPSSTRGRAPSRATAQLRPGGGETLALGSLEPQQPALGLGVRTIQQAAGFAPVLIESNAGNAGLDELELEKTAVFRRSEPARPDVPQLRFSTRSATRQHQPSLPGSTSREVFTEDKVGAALDALDEVGTATPAIEGDSGPVMQTPGLSSTVATAPTDPATPTASQHPPQDAGRGARPARSGSPPTGSGLMALLTGPTNGAPSTVPRTGETALDPGDLDPAAAAAPVVAPRKHQTSSALSATMRLFIQGLDEEDLERPHNLSSPTNADEDRDPTFGGLTGVEDTVPRTIKPTVLGWIVLLLLVGGATLFVVHKKTSLFRDRADDSVSTLSAADLAFDPRDAHAQPTTGNLVISVKPASADLLLHLGDAPVTSPPVDTGRSYVLRIEREGYRTEHRVVEPRDFERGKAAIQVTVAPVGAGARHEAPPEVKPGTPSGTHGTIHVVTDPPAASVWLLLGKGRAELEGVPARRYYFKVLATGHETAYMTVGADEFDKAAGGLVTRALELDPAGADSGPGAGADPPVTDAAPRAASGDDATADASPAGKVKPSPRPPRRPVKRIRRVPSRKSDQPAPRKDPKKGPRKDPKKGLTLPSWAR